MILMGMHRIYDVTTGILYFSPVDTSHLILQSVLNVWLMESEVLRRVM